MHPPRETRAATVHNWSLADLALSRPVMVGMLLVAVFLLGLLATFELPLAFMPSRTSPRISIRFRLPRTSPELLERDIIRPIEEQVAGLRGLSRIQVGSGAWGVRVNLEFVAGTDIDARKIEVRERIDRLKPDLPDNLRNIEIDSARDDDAPVMALRIASNQDLSSRYNDIIRHIVRPLERIEGVGRVEFNGAESNEFEIALDLEALVRNGIAPTDVGSVLRGARQNRSLGVLRSNQATPGLRSPALHTEIQTYAQLPLSRRTGATSTPSTIANTASGLSPPVDENNVDTTNSSGAPARLQDIATVSIHPQEVRAFRRLDGKGGINLEVFARAGASPVEVSERIREVLTTFDKDPVLSGIETVVFFDQGEIITNTLRDLRNTGVYGGILGVIVLFLFLRRFLITLVAATCIPLTILATCGVLLMRGEELNCIVLLGLVLGVGMLIDNAVVIVEAIEQHARAGEPRGRAILFGSREVGLATIASTLSSVIVFLPLVFGDPADPISAFLRPLGATFATVLLCSLVISQTAVPLCMQWVLRRPSRPQKTPLLDALSNAYARLIRISLRWRRATLLVALAIAGSAIYPAMEANYNLGNAEEQPDDIPIGFEFFGSPGHRRIHQHLEVVEQALLARKDELGLEHISCSYSDWWAHCSAHPKSPAQSEAEVEALKNAVKMALPEQAGLRYRVGEDRFRRHRSHDRHEIQIAIMGEDMGELMTLSNKVVNHLRSTLTRGSIDNPEAGGFDTITGPADEGSQELHIKLDPSRLRRLGLRSDDIAQTVATAFQGLSLGQVHTDGGEIELRMSAGTVSRREALDEGEATELSNLRDLRINLPEGGDVTLGSLAHFETARSPFFIQRVDRETQITVKIRFFSPEPDENRELVNAAMDAFNFPPGYRSGDPTPWRQRREGENAMLINLGMCLLLVYAVMASLFESFLQPFAILATCLLGCFGAPWAMWFTGTTIDTVAMIGLFILIGIVVNNGIMLIDRVLQLRNAGMSRNEALERAGRDRLRPILMTATTTVLGLLPMLLHHPTLAGVYYHSIAIIISGGLVTSTFVTLVFLPAIYSVIEDISLASINTFRRFGGLR